MISAFTVQDVGCIRYKGRNRAVQILLIGSGEGDHLPSDLGLLNDEVKADRSGLR